MGTATTARRPHAAYPELSSSYSAALHAGGGCLSEGPVGRVGLELEAHCVDLSDPMRRPDWAELTDAVASVPELPGGGTITMEPGGAIELSGPPLDGPMTAVAAMAADRAVLR
ncbi:MAG: glutamate-cysteine ligase family protein, partial [Mycobacterium sp.]